MITLIRSKEFDRWMKKLKNRQALHVIAERLAYIERGHFGDVKSVGEGISEARIHYANGYRLYFIQRGHTVVIMLAGGDKSSQARDIKRAKELATQWR